MKVHELIAILQKLDQQAVVYRYSPDYYIAVETVDQINGEGWDHNSNCPVFEVVIE